jgi:hypothetical protein
MEASSNEVLLKETHEHLVYVWESACGGEPVPAGWRKAAKDCYGQGGLKIDDAVARLCGTIHSFGKNEMNTIVYDGRNPKARRLADWYERHCKADAKRAKKKS